MSRNEDAFRALFGTAPPTEGGHLVHPRTNPRKTQAAMALYAQAILKDHASSQGTRRARRSLLSTRRALHTHPDHNHATADLLVETEAGRFALLGFLDGSALLWREDDPDHDSSNDPKGWLLPWILKVRRRMIADAPRIRVCNPSRSRVGGLWRIDDHGAGPVVCSERVVKRGERTALAALERLREDVRAMAPAFAGAKALSATDLERDPPACPSFLPHLAATPAQIQAARSLARDLADWLATEATANHPDRAGASVEIETDLQGRAPFLVSVKRELAKAGSHRTADLHDTLRAGELLPPDAAHRVVREVGRIAGHQLRAHVKEHDIEPVVVARALSRTEEVSAHRRLELVAKFGRPAAPLGS